MGGEEIANYLSLVSFSPPLNPHSVHSCMTSLKGTRTDVATPSKAPPRVGRVSDWSITR